MPPPLHPVFPRAPRCPSAGQLCAARQVRVRVRSCPRDARMLSTSVRSQRAHRDSVSGFGIWDLCFGNPQSRMCRALRQCWCWCQCQVPTIVRRHCARHMHTRSCRASPNKPSPQPPPPSTRPEPDHPARSRAAREVLGLGVPTSTVTTHATCSEAWLSSRVPSAQMRRCARLLYAQAEKSCSRAGTQARRAPRASGLRPRPSSLKSSVECRCVWGRGRGRRSAPTPEPSQPPPQSAVRMYSTQQAH